MIYRFLTCLAVVYFCALIVVIVAQGRDPAYAVEDAWQGADAKCAHAMRRATRGEPVDPGTLAALFRAEAEAWARYIETKPRLYSAQRRVWIAKGGGQPRRCVDAAPAIVVVPLP